jgi:hypothetical protein
MIKILPNIYLSTEFDVLNNNLVCDNIDTVLIFINDMGDMGDTNGICEQNILTNKDNVLTIKNITQSYPINFNFLEKIILDYLTYSKNLLIVSKDNLYGFTVISGFIMKYLGVTFIDIIILSQHHKININNTLEYQELSNFNTLLQKNIN